MPSRGIDCRNTFRGLTVPQHQNEFIPEVTQEWLRFETGVARLPICFLAIRSAHDGRTIDGDVQRVLSAVTGNRLAIDIRANVLVLETTAGTGHRDSDSEPKFVAAASPQRAPEVPVCASHPARQAPPRLSSPRISHNGPKLFNPSSKLPARRRRCASFPTIVSAQDEAAILPSPRAARGASRPRACCSPRSRQAA